MSTTRTPDTTSDPPAHEAAAPHRPLVRRRFGWKVLAVLAAGFLVLALLGFGYVWRATRTPEGSGPEYLRQWESVVRWQPDNVAARLELGYAYRQAGERARALEQFEAVLEREPLNTGALYNRAMVLLETGNRKQAEEDLWRVLEAEPGHVQAAIALGEYYADRQEYRSLLVAVRPVLELRPEVARLHYLTGLGYENTGHPDWAAARYELALERDPNLLEARRGLERLSADR